MESEILIGIVIGSLILFGLFRKSKTKNIQKEINKEYSLKADKNNFKDDFIQLITEKPNLDYLVINFGDYYIQYVGWENSKELYCEVVSNEFLKDSNRLNETQIKKIIDLTFSEPNTKDSDGNSSPNYSKFYSAKNEIERNKIFDELIFIISEIYTIKNDQMLKITYD